MRHGGVKRGLSPVFPRFQNGNVHRFEGTTGGFHWNGSTGDAGNQLSASYIPAAVQKTLGVRLK